MSSPIDVDSGPIKIQGTSIDALCVFNKPPGIAAFQRAGSDAELAALALSLLMKVQESKVLKLPSGSKEWTLKWKELYLLAFFGRLTEDGRHDNNGVLSGYTPWTCSNPASAKLKPLLIEIIDHFSMSYTQRIGCDEPTNLEVLAHALKQDIIAAEQLKQQKVITKSILCMLNVAIETSLDFCSPIVGVSIPSQSSPNHDQEYNAALLLGQQTQNVARTITGEFVLYELLVQIMINPHAYFHQQEILIHII